MELLFLGTSSGTPSKSRNVSGLALRTGAGGHWALIDCGEGTQHRILHTPLSLIGLRAVFITHLHGDHVYGLPGLLESAGMLNRTEPLYLVGPPGLKRLLDAIIGAADDGLPYPLVMIDVENVHNHAPLAAFHVESCALSHRVPSYAYSFTEREVERKLDKEKLLAAGVPSGPVWGRIQAGEDVALEDGRTLAPRDFLLMPRAYRKIIVGGDNDTPSLIAPLAEGAQVLVHEATYTEEVLRKVGPEPQHSSAAMTAAFAQEAGIPNLVLTHFSPRYQGREGPLSMAALEEEARTHYHGRLFLAEDFARYELGRNGELEPAGDARAARAAPPQAAGSGTA